MDRYPAHKKIVRVYEEPHPHYSSDTMVMAEFENHPQALCILMYETDKYHFDFKPLIGKHFEAANLWLREHKRKQRKLLKLINPER